jgi:hypothetical protein
MDFKLEFTDKEITPYGGLVLLKRMIDKSGLLEYLSTLPLPKPRSNRGYNPTNVIISFMLSIWCGANRFVHTEITRGDNALKKIFGLGFIPSSPTLTRFFRKFSFRTNNEIFTDIYQWFFNNLQFNNFTIDFDSSVLSRYGNQEGAKKGYNPQKPGRKSHHPLMAFIDDCNMVANFWLRPGNTGASSNFLNFLDDTLNKLKGKTVGLLRADSGFFGEDIFEYLESLKINYIIATKFYSTVKRTIANAKSWLYLSEGVEITEDFFQSPDWKKPRRVIMVRQKIDRRPNATGKKVTLFGEEIDHGAYRYSCFMTNLDLPAAIVWRSYRGRANAENRIKELKYDFGFDSFNMNDFFATEAALNFAMLAYNLMSLFKHAIIKGDKYNMLSTLRFKLFNVCSYITTNGNSKILNLSLAPKRRQWFLGLWDNSRHFSMPVFY